MKKYKVYFEIYGKKMVSTIEAHSESGAQAILKDKIIFHKVSLIEKNTNPDFKDSDLDSAFQSIKKALNL